MSLFSWIFLGVNKQRHSKLWFFAFVKRLEKDYLWTVVCGFVEEFPLIVTFISTRNNYRICFSNRIWYGPFNKHQGFFGKVPLKLFTFCAFEKTIFHVYFYVQTFIYTLIRQTKLVECVVDILAYKIYSLQDCNYLRCSDWYCIRYQAYSDLFINIIGMVIMFYFWCYIFQTVRNNYKDISYINEDFVNFNLLNTQVVWMR